MGGFVGVSKLAIVSGPRRLEYRKALHAPFCSSSSPPALRTECYWTIMFLWRILRWDGRRDLPRSKVRFIQRNWEAATIFISSQVLAASSQISTIESMKLEMAPHFDRPVIISAFPFEMQCSPSASTDLASMSNGYDCRASTSALMSKAALKNQTSTAGHALSSNATSDPESSFLCKVYLNVDSCGP